jgi:hypothetical protein
MILLLIPESAKLVVEALPPARGIKYVVFVAQSTLVTQGIVAWAEKGHVAPKNRSSPGRKAYAPMVRLLTVDPKSTVPSSAISMEVPPSMVAEKIPWTELVNNPTMLHSHATYFSPFSWVFILQ